MLHDDSKEQPTSEDRVRTAYDAVYRWDYGSEIDPLRALYVRGLELQWIAGRDLPFEQGIDREAFARTFSMAGMPLHRTRFFQELPSDKRWEISSRSTAFLLSNFLHGEQGALFVASQLVNAVPHMDGKFYAATQTLDEARHVEVFARYISELDRVYPIAPALRRLLDGIIAAEDWKMKCVGMQIVVEGLALYSFRDMRGATEEPLLKQLLTYVSRDEARHTAFGIRYLANVVPTLSAREVAELEDFAFETARLLIDSRSGLTMRESILELWRSVGFDPAEVIQAVVAERDVIQAAIAEQGGRRGPLTGFVLPTMRSIGLFSERIRGHFQGIFDHQAKSRGSSHAASVDDMMVALPEDIEAWAVA